MEPTANTLRGRLFGGFDRRDVVEYIEQLAAQRNALLQENEALKEQLSVMEEQRASAPVLPDEDAPADDLAAAVEEFLEKVQKDMQSAEVSEQEEKKEAERKADQLLAELEEKFQDTKTDVEVTTSHMRCELQKMSDMLSALSLALESTGRRIHELRTGQESE